MQTNNPFFSIIIPTLNEEECLPRLLAQLEKQSYREFEIVMVDGGSTDETIRHAKHYQKQFAAAGQRFDLINSPHQAISPQRNKGAAAAHGEYFIYFDADSQIGSDFLEQLHGQLVKTHDDLVTTRLLPDASDILSRFIIWIMNSSFSTSRYLPHVLLPGSNITVSKKAFATIGGFDPAIKLGEDNYFGQQARAKGIAIHILSNPPVIFSLRRIRTEGIWRATVIYISAIVSQLIHGPIRDNRFHYEMGGQYYKKDKA